MPAPQRRLLVAAARRKQVASRREDNGIDGRVARESRFALARTRVPNRDQLVAAARREYRRIDQPRQIGRPLRWRECKGEHVVVVHKLVRADATRGVPDSNFLVHAARGEHERVGSEGESVDRALRYEPERVGGRTAGGGGWR